MNPEQNQAEEHLSPVPVSYRNPDAPLDATVASNEENILPSTLPFDPFTPTAFKRRFYVFAGYFFVGLGIIGIIIPLLPTTPFLLLATGCFTKGSHHAKQWLLTHKVLGPYITAFRQGQGLTRQQKWRIGLAFSVTLGVSMTMAPLLAIQILCAVIWVGLMFFLITGRTNHQNSAK